MPLPYLTATVPGIGGRLRTEPEDFQVDERPLYLPCWRRRTPLYQGDQAAALDPRFGPSNLIDRRRQDQGSWHGRSQGCEGRDHANAVTSRSDTRCVWLD